MTPITPQTVFIATSPLSSLEVGLINNLITSDTIKEKPNSYVFSKDELKDLLLYVFANGGIYGGELIKDLPTTTTPSQFVNSLLK